MNFIYISENLTVFLHRTDGCFFCCFKAFVTTKWPVLKHAELKAFHENSNLCFIVIGVWLDENKLV